MKKFEVHGEKTPAASPENERGRFSITWHKQENPSDCGPMAILNALIRIDFPNRPTSVQQIRDAVAQRRLADGQSLNARVGGDIRTTGWLASSDLHKYLRSLQMPADILSRKPDVESVKKELLANPHKFFIFATGNHFKVVRYTGPGEAFELLDSMKSGPETISKEEAYRVLDQSIGFAGVLAG